MDGFEYHSLSFESKKSNKGKIAAIVSFSILFLCIIGAAIATFFLFSTIGKLQGEIDTLRQTNEDIQNQNADLLNRTEALVVALTHINVTLLAQEVEGIREEVIEFIEESQIEMNSLKHNIVSLNALVSSPKPPCNLQCYHGGYPSADCTSCDGCQKGWAGTQCNVPSTCQTKCSEENCDCHNGGTLDSNSCSCVCLQGWLGSDCSTLDPNVTPQDRINILGQLKNQASSSYEDFSTIPSHLGYGVDMTSRNIGLPVIKLSFDSNNSQSIISPFNTIYNIPDGVMYEELLGGMDWPVHKTELFNNFRQYIDQLFQWSNERDGFIEPLLQGISLQEIQDTYFANTSFMSQTQAYYGAYALSLSASLSSYQLDHHAQLAIDYIAKLPFNEANRPVFYYFLENWGTSVIIDDIEGGLLQFACIIPSGIWSWGGGEGQVSPAFIKGNAEGNFRDKTQGTSFTSAVFSQSSLCEFYCVGGNPENCPTSANGIPTSWKNTIWADPQSIQYHVVPISEMIMDSNAKQSIQMAIYSYYKDISQNWISLPTSCSMCLPQLNSFLIASNVPYNVATYINPGTCSTAIRVAATGACFFIMTDNGTPINGGTNDCDFRNPSLWGIAALNSISNPVVEFIITEVNQAHNFVSSKCHYRDVDCVYWTGSYEVSCV